MMRSRAAYRPCINNSPIAKRRNSDLSPLRAKSARGNPTKTARRRRVSAHVSQGAHILGIVTAAATVIAAIFIFALHSQTAAQRLGRDEVDLRSALDQTAAERRYLVVEQGRALNPQAGEQRSRAAGLEPMKFEARSPYAPPKSEAAPKTDLSRVPAKPKAEAAALKAAPAVERRVTAVAGKEKTAVGKNKKTEPAAALPKAKAKPNAPASPVLIAAVTKTRRR